MSGANSELKNSGGLFLLNFDFPRCFLSPRRKGKQSFEDFDPKEKCESDFLIPFVFIRLLQTWCFLWTGNRIIAYFVLWVFWLFSLAYNFLYAFALCNNTNVRICCSRLCSYLLDNYLSRIAEVKLIYIWVCLHRTILNRQVPRLSPTT